MIRSQRANRADLAGAGPRIRREARTVAAMIDLYCRAYHSPADAPCAECAALRDYATARLRRCPFQENKTTCARCPVHCYRPAMRERIRAVMRFSGPRMLARHPLLALRHLADGMRDAPLARPGGARPVDKRGL